MHKIVTSIWHMLSKNTDYQDLGSNHRATNPQQAERRRRRLLAELKALTTDTASAIPT
jgi:hypothetical protein